MSLVGGRVLVTGATGGIGQAIARAFAGRGAELMLTGRRLEVLQPLAEELGARAATCDLADPEQVAGLAADALQWRADVLVANAALPASGLLTELTDEQVERILQVNLHAPIGLARALAPQMIERGQGHMVFISSLSGKVAAPSSSLYSATKFGLRGFALGLREDLQPHGVGVSSVFPGFISGAGMFADAGVRLPRGIGTRTPEQVAAAVITTIVRNRAELDVAPLQLRLGAAFAGLAPQIAATFSRLGGSARIAADLTAGQVDKR